MKKTIQLLILILTFSSSLLRAQHATTHYLNILPLSVAERHFGLGVGAGYSFITRKSFRNGLCIPLNIYKGIFVQVGKPTANYPDIKSTYIRFSPTYYWYPVDKSNIRYGLGLGLDYMFAYGNNAVEVNSLNQQNYISKNYTINGLGLFISNKLSKRIGQNNNRFEIDLGLGNWLLHQEKNYNAINPIFKFNLGFAFML